MADEEVVAVQEKQSSGKGVMMLLIALIVILILVVAGGGYMLYSKGVFSDAQAQPAAQEAAAPSKSESSSGEFFKVDINDMVLNITNAKGREKLMKLSFSIKSTEEGIEQLVEQNKPEIIDVVISQISSRNSEELLTVGGKELLKEELIQDINTVLDEAIGDSGDFKKDSVKKIYFTAFVIK
ncbi:MAG: flagellar basal body-associated FliL family protein [Candidatus Marinarcus sp.]|uniref:flagellar basal body-associated FliL family protein n=1 Tax=Candidatus Marinarcus sp. TaxID=3100987 RepID=UPI003B00F93D